MVDLEVRVSAIGDDRNPRPSRSAGLYGELPALPAHFPVESPAASAPRKPRRGSRQAD